jgi:hypothetical protein
VSKLQRRAPQSTKLQRKAPEPVRGCDEQEQRVADAIGGERVRGSGCSPWPGRKGDAVSEMFRAETKTTQARGIRVERDYLIKIRDEAMATGRRPIFAFGFDGNKREDWIAFELPVAEHMLLLINAVENGDADEARRLVELIRP